MKFNIRIKKINLKQTYGQMIECLKKCKKEFWIFILLFILLLWNVFQQSYLIKLQKEVNYSCSSYKLEDLREKIYSNTQSIDELSKKEEEITEDIKRIKENIDDINNDIYQLNRYSHTHTYY